MANEPLTSDNEGDSWLGNQTRVIWDKFMDLLLKLRGETRNIIEFEAEPTGGGYDISITEENLLQRPERNTRTVHINTAGYEPPKDGIPKEGLSRDVQELLDKAGSALQEETDPVYMADREGIFSEIESLDEATENLLGLLDENVFTSLELNTNESTIVFEPKLTNLKTKEPFGVPPIPMQVVDLDHAGIWDTTMFRQFTAMDEAITALNSQISGQPRTAVVSELEDDNPETLTAAFIDAVGSEPTEGDRLIITSNQTEWIFDNEGDWIMLGVIPLELATSTNDGLVSHNDVDGGVVYFVAGKGQVKGWDAAKALIQKNANDISTLDTNLSALSTSVEELRVSVADNAKLKIFAAGQETAAQQWSNDNPTYLVLVQA